MSITNAILQWMADCPDVPFIGLSAPRRGRAAWANFTTTCSSPRRRASLIDAGYLADFVAFAPSDPDLSSVSTGADGDFKAGRVGRRDGRASITGDIVLNWLKRGENRPTIVFCVNRKHAQHVCERFVEAGVRGRVRWTATRRTMSRRRIFARFRSGETKVLCNVGVLTTGVDLPMSGASIDAQPTKSRILFVQKIGRGLRTAEGKANLRIHRSRRQSPAAWRA